MKNSFQLKAFLTFLSRNKLYTGVTLLGFSVSLAFVLLVGLYLQDEYRVDAWHEKGDRIYRLEATNDLFSGAKFAPGIARALQDRYPDIEATTRSYFSSLTIETPAPKNEKMAEGGLIVDSSFFSIFSFPFVEGRAQDVLRNPNEVVLTESFARKIYGERPALGQVLKIENKEYVVSGVVEDFHHTHFRHPAVLLPFSVLGDLWGIGPDQWDTMLQGNNDFSTYLLAKQGADLPSKLTSVELDRFFKEDIQKNLFLDGHMREARLNPIREVYFSPFFNAESMRNDPVFLNVLLVTVLLVLFFALVNHINLSVAQTGFRAKEVAMRRLLGGSRAGLFASFILESLLLCVVSFGLALLLASVLEPWFGRVMNSSVGLSNLLTPLNVSAMLAGVLLLGVLAGVFPALVIGRFRPIDVVKGTFRRYTKTVYGKVLISFQYAVTIVLIGCTLVIGKQVHYMKTTDLGFRTSNLLSFRNPVSFQSQASFRDELMGIPGVEAVSFADAIPGIGNYNGRLSHYDKQGNMQDLAGFFGDSAYVSVLGFEVMRTTGVEDPGAVYLNQTAWRKLGLSDGAIEYTNAQDPRYNFKIRGMVRDFFTDDLTNPIAPAVIVPVNRGRRVFVRLSEGADQAAVTEQIRECANRKHEGNLFDGIFMDQMIASLYQKQDQTLQIVGMLSATALALSLMGMLAMATYFTRQRLQQIAIRKVFGSTSSGVLARLLWAFLSLVGVAFVVAVSVIAYLMRDWLGGYAYRIPLTWDIFALAGAAVLLVAALTIFGQLLHAATVNPVKLLKSE